MWNLDINFQAYLTQIFYHRYIKTKLTINPKSRIKEFLILECLLKLIAKIKTHN